MIIYVYNYMIYVCLCIYIYISPYNIYICVFNMEGPQVTMVALILSHGLMTWFWGYLPPWIGNLNLEFSMEHASVNGEMIGIIDIEKGI